MKQTVLKLGLLFIFILILGAAHAQSLQHPIIWGTAGDKAEILAKIENHSWAASIVTKAKAAVDDKVNTHLTNPSAILNTIPAFATQDNLAEAEASANNAQHAKVLNYASYASMLYYVTGEEKYAQFAADILWSYIEELAPKTPENTAMSGSHFYDPRAGYLQFAVAYDFMLTYLKQSGTRVYKKSTGSKVAFDNVKAQKAVHNIAMNALQEHAGADNRIGQRVSNHPILRAPGVLFSILCVENDAERERMFKVFWNTGTKNQNSFILTILPMFGEQGIWPEAVSYSFMPNITLVLNVVDRIKPEMNVMANYKHILDGNFLFDNLRHPNRRFVRYGDSHRDNDGTGELYRYTLDLAARRGFAEYEQKAKVALRQAYDAEGGYDPAVPFTTFDNLKAFGQLFFGIDIPKTIDGEIDFQKPSVIIEHAGVALQRNYVEENNIDYGLCGIIGGAHYVHSHCTGITMELYGADYIMAANAGLPHSLAERKVPIHTDYFWRHAGNNTIIVNGTTHGIQTGSWKTNSDLWMNTTVNVAAEPKHLEDPINPNFSFATQFLGDEVNNCEQQRTLSTIRTSKTSGYYFDMFRSKSLGKNNFHDYVYHNIGDETHIFNSNGDELSVSATTRYQTDIGDTYKSPGWRFFEDTQVTESFEGATKVRFNLNETNTYMNMFVPAGVAREYTKALGPATREAKGGYEDKKTQIIAIRQQGEAWNKPYVNIFEPSISEKSSVKSVEHLYRGDVIVGAKVMSQIDNKTLTDYVICQEDETQIFTLPELGLTFEGRFAVVRTEQDMEKSQITLYIGEGSSLAFGNHVLEADADKRGTLVVEGQADVSGVLGFKNLANNTIIERGSTLSVEAVVGSDFTEVALWVNNVKVEALTQAPYVWEGYAQLSNMTESSYVLTLIAKDANNEVKKNSISVLTPGQWARTKDYQPHPVPGIIQFENYDYGGADVAYYDRSAVDSPKYSYWENDAVDLNSSKNRISYIQGKEWFEYTINVESTGYYDLFVNHQTRKTPEFEALTVSFPEENKVLFSKNILSYTGTGSFTTDLLGNVLLEKGTHVIRFYMDNYGFDLDYFEFQLTLAVGNNEIKIEQPKIKIYPNPANTKVTIALDGVKTADVAIYNMAGQLMLRKVTSNSRIQLSRGSEYKPGMYLVRVLDENKQAYYNKLVFK